MGRIENPRPEKDANCIINLNDGGRRFCES